MPKVQRSSAAMVMGMLAIGTSGGMSLAQAGNSTQPAPPASRPSPATQPALPAGWSLEAGTQLDQSVIDAIGAGENLCAQRYTESAGSLFRFLSDNQSGLLNVTQYKLGNKSIGSLPLTEADKLNGVDCKYSICYSQLANRHWNKSATPTEPAGWGKWKDPGMLEGVFWSVTVERAHGSWSDASPTPIDSTATPKPAKEIPPG